MKKNTLLVFPVRRSLLDIRSFSVGCGVGGLFSCLLIFLILPLSAQAVTIPTGQPCTSHTQCSHTDYCSPPPNMVCTNDLADGQSPCFANQMCSSNKCDLSTTTCVVSTTTPPPTTASTQPSAATTSQPSGAAPSTTNSTVTSLPNPLRTTSINLLIGRVTRYVVGISGTLALVIFIYGGLMWIFSQGKADMINKGKKAISYSVIGLVIIFTSYIVIRFIITALTKFT